MEIVPIDDAAAVVEAVEPSVAHADGCAGCDPESGDDAQYRPTA